MQVVIRVDDGRDPVVGRDFEERGVELVVLGDVDRVNAVGEPHLLQHDRDLLSVNFAAHRKAVETGPLTLARAGRYLVLRPVEPKPALDWLAAQCVNAFETFAAEPDEIGDEHRHLSPYQRLLLRSFGHPQVMSEYRFSIALTGPLDSAHLERVSQALWPVLQDICAEGVTVDGLSLFGDTSGRTPMRLIGRYKLGG